MITLLFFAKYKEELQTEQLQLDWQPEWQSLKDVRDHLAQRGAPWTILEDPTLMCALNEEMCPLSSAIKDGDELVFFPMVTGG